MSVIQTYIVEKNDLIREGVKAFVSGRNYKIAGEYRNIDDLTLPPELEAPQLVIIGINIRVLSAYNAQEEITKFKLQLERIRHTLPDSNLILLISQEALFHIPDLYSWDVDGYICRDITKDGFLNYLNLAMMGERIIPAPLLYTQAKGNSHSYMANDASALHNGHTPNFSVRENDILRYIVRGSPNKRIAVELSITESTVKVHLKTILRKLGVNNRTQAALWAMKNGFNGSAESMLLLCLYNSALIEMLA